MRLLLVQIREFSMSQAAENQDYTDDDIKSAIAIVSANAAKYSRWAIQAGGACALCLLAVAALFVWNWQTSSALSFADIDIPVFVSQTGAPAGPHIIDAHIPVAQLLETLTGPIAKTSALVLVIVFGLVAAMTGNIGAVLPAIALAVMVNFLPAVMGQHVDLGGKGSAQLKQLAAERKFAELATQVDQVMPAREGAYVKAQAAYLQKQFDVVANELEKLGTETGKGWVPSEDRMIAMEAAAFGAPKTAATIKTLAERRALSEDLAAWETKMEVLAGVFGALGAMLLALGAYESARSRQYVGMLKDSSSGGRAPEASHRTDSGWHAAPARSSPRASSSPEASTATADAIYLGSLNNYAMASLIDTADSHCARSSSVSSGASFTSVASDCGSSGGGSCDSGGGCD